MCYKNSFVMVVNRNTKEFPSTLLTDNIIGEKVIKLFWSHQFSNFIHMCIIFCTRGCIIIAKHYFICGNNTIFTDIYTASCDKRVSIALFSAAKTTCSMYHLVFPLIWDSSFCFKSKVAK